MESEDTDKEEVAQILGSGFSMNITRYIEMMMCLGRKIDGKIRPLRTNNLRPEVVYK